MAEPRVGGVRTPVRNLEKRVGGETVKTNGNRMDAISFFHLFPLRGCNYQFN